MVIHLFLLREKSKSLFNVIVESSKKDSKDIWDAEEVPEGAEYEDLNDPRIKPE